MKKKGILFVINDFNVGGAEIFVLRFGKALTSKYNVFITDLSPHRVDQKFKNQYLKAGFNYFHNKFEFSEKAEWFYWKLNALFCLIGYKNFHNTLKQKRQKSYWIKKFKKHNIEIINSHLIASDEFVHKTIYPLMNKISFKWILTMHSSYNPLHYQFKDQIERKLFFNKVKTIMNSADSIVGVAQENFSIFNEIEINKKPIKIYLGFQPKKAKGKSYSDDKVKLLMIGRGIKEKGWELMLQAFENLNQKYDNLELYLVGPLTDYMLSLKEKYPLKNIFFEGYQSDTQKYYQQSFITLLPSHGESLPYTVIESLGYGVPVIVSNRGEMPEMVYKDETYAGLIVEDNLSTNLPCVKVLQEQIEKLLDDSNLYNQLKNNTAHVFEKFSIDFCVNEYEKLF